MSESSRIFPVQVQFGPSRVRGGWVGVRVKVWILYAFLTPPTLTQKAINTLYNVYTLCYTHT
jgi:hypothetical protein